MCNRLPKAVGGESPDLRTKGSHGAVVVGTKNGMTPALCQRPATHHRDVRVKTEDVF